MEKHKFVITEEELDEEFENGGNTPSGPTPKKKWRGWKFVYLSIALLVNAFIIVQAALPAVSSSKWSNSVVSFFANLFRGGQATEAVPCQSIDLNIQENTGYNQVPGYKDDEIVLGKEKALEVNILPTNATDTAVEYIISNPDVISINQYGGEAYITGKKLGTVTITAISRENSSLQSSMMFEVVDKITPTFYGLDSIEVVKGSVFKIPYVMEEGERFLSYYDFSPLEVSFDHSIMEKYNSEYYLAKEIGEATLKVGDKTAKVIVTDNASTTYPIFNNIDGADNIIPYQDRLFYVNSNTGTTDYFWEVDSELLFIEDGMICLRENVQEASKATITARSTLDPNISVSKVIDILPTNITDVLLYDANDYYNFTNYYYLADLNQEIKIRVLDSTATGKFYGYTVTNSNPEVAKIYTEGEIFSVECVKEGRTIIEVYFNGFPDTKGYIDLEVRAPGVINNSNFRSVGEFIRKSIGHFALFFVSGCFTFLTIYSFLQAKSTRLKRWKIVLIVLAIGFAIALASEAIQHFVPSRYGSMVDVSVDFFGFLLGLLVPVIVLKLIERRKNRKIIDSYDNNRY